MPERQKAKILWLFCLITVSLLIIASTQKIPEPDLFFSPYKYICQRSFDTIKIDGRLNEKSWQAADWTEVFGDIEGKKKPAPRFRTRVQMLWDDEYFYIGAYLEEPDLWATLTERDSIIFMDNDFEVFIDPDGDTHNYYEIEINALNTVWDLLLVKPYRDGGPAIHGWDIKGLKTAVNLMGTLNDPSDRDKGWTVEMAIPFSALKEGIQGGKEKPAPSDVWRVNFSRVEYWLDIEGNNYLKRKDPVSNQTLPEDNWTWTPQGLINMHYPEMWGYVKFSVSPAGTKKEKFSEEPEEKVKWALRMIYYRQWDKYQKEGRFATDLESLRLSQDRAMRIKNWSFPPQIYTTKSLFEAVYISKTGVCWHISQDGLVWKTEASGPARKGGSQ